VEGTSNRRGEATVSNFHGLVWTCSKSIDFFFVVWLLQSHYKKKKACKGFSDV